jgi:hypothetical protein
VPCHQNKSFTIVSTIPIRILRILDNMTTNELASGFGPLSGDGWIGRWSPGIGDPTIMGWLTVVLYALGAWQCYRVATTHSSLLRPREGALWWMLVYGLLAFGINKQLDLQSALTEIGRIFAAQQGWYEKRHEVQILFIYGVAAFAIFATIALAVLARKAPLATFFALTGSVCLFSFVVIRAASFHHFDLYIGSVIFGLRMNWILEMGGICIIVASARWRLQTH